MIEGDEGAKAMLPGWWFDRAEGVGVGVVVSCELFVFVCCRRKLKKRLTHSRLPPLGLKNP